MADNASHLEKMGRELKCPICLSLFNSAVSLTCNHVFCNSCIYKSMKSGSDCPVCKVPFQRREIRPAPHMDNLVNIYKSMEVASGLTLFVTQNESTAKSDALKLTEGNVDSGNEDTDGQTSHKVKQKKKEASGSTLSRSKVEHSGRSRGKSSFSMNKRVQVPESPSTDTPLRQATHELLISNNVMNQSLVHRSSECPLSNEKESPHLAPFFWLLEDDAEKSSQHTDGDPLTCTPMKVPSFSDIKDSDDDEPSKLSPNWAIRKCDNAELFESEMFEWTQRPCSPELCSSPLKMQVDKVVGHSGLSEKETKARLNDALREEVTTDRLDDVNPQDTNMHRINERQSNSCAACKTDDSQSGCKIPSKRGRKQSKRRQNKRQKKDLDKTGEGHPLLDSTKDFKEAQGPGNNLALGNSIPEVAATIRSCASDMKILDNLGDQVVSKSQASGVGEGTNADKTSESGKGSSTSGRKTHGNRLSERNKRMEKVVKGVVNNDNIVSEDGKVTVTNAESNLLAERSIEKPSAAGSTSNHKNKRNRKQVTSQVKENIPLDPVLQEKLMDGTVCVSTEAAAVALVDSINEAVNNNNAGVSLKPGKVSDKEMSTLSRCNRSSIKCAFCHSPEETGASGEMVHYAHGKPVPATHIADPVIHSHKYCTEWAPNVYFHNDTAVNLDDELARSRRIKCSLCGKKGAALGCFEKSCRKSFHVPCAKMLRECRWDTEHFVMLCSIHASSKLPSEMPISQASLLVKGKRNPKGKLHHQRHQTSTQLAATNKWSCGRSSEKIVICGSALANDEKEIISDFIKLSGAAMSAHWNPSITHVIASTNENGACKRTLKFLMGILEGKWILSIQWVHACMKAKRLVEETPYEISCDSHGIRNGPRLGRFRLSNQQPRLFTGFKFYFSGDFESSYKGYLQDLIIAAGGAILNRKPVDEYSEVSASCSALSPTVIVYSIEQPDNCGIRKKDSIVDRRRFNAEVLASSSGARVASNTWVLNCIAGHKLQDL